MIGGIDTFLPTPAGSRAIEPAVRTIRAYWPRATFEDANTAERFDSFFDLPFGKVTELFVYRDTEAARGWDEEGAVDRLHNTMVHLIADPSGLTVVVDATDPLMTAMIEGVRSALGDELFALTPTGTGAA